MKKIHSTNIVILRGDITEECVDVIVNAANRFLAGGGGVDGAIHEAGGPAIMAECEIISKTRGVVPTGEVAITTAGDLPAKYVIHAVGPVWNKNQPEECDKLLQNAYLNSLIIAEKYGLSTISFPAISTGIYGFPIERATPLVFNVLNEYLKEKNCFKEIRFVLFSSKDFEVYNNAFDAMFGGI